MAKARKVARKASKAELGSTTRGILGKSKGVASVIPQKFSSSSEKEKVIKELANTVAMIAVDDIKTNPKQPRKEFLEDALKDLSGSIKVHGLIQPLTVRLTPEKEYELISGERRLRASKMAGLKEVPAYIRIADDRQMAEMAIVENVQREDLNPLEMAISLSRLKEEFKLTDEDVADKIGKKRTTITNYLRVLVLPDNIQQAVRDGDISMGHAKALAGVDVMKRQDLFSQIIDEHLSVRALEQKIRDLNAPKVPKEKKAAAPSLPTEYEAVQRKLREFFENPTIKLQLKGDKKGQIVLPFKSVDQLNDMLDLLDK